MQHTNAKRTGSSDAPIQVFYSEQDAVKACELAGERCQAISKFKEKTTFVYTLASNLNLFTEANSTLYVKAEFREKVSKYRYICRGKAIFHFRSKTYTYLATGPGFQGFYFMLVVFSS